MTIWSSHVTPAYSLGFEHALYDHEAKVWDGFALSVTYKGSVLPLLDATCHRCVGGGQLLQHPSPQPGVAPILHLWSCELFME